jgi:YaiO family outer membrane protein
VVGNQVTILRSAEAEAEAEAVAESATNDPMVRAQKALRERDLLQARQLIESELARTPGDPDWRLLHADWQAASGQLTNALAALRRITVDHPTHRRAHFREAQVLTQLGRLRSAELKYEAYLQDAPNDLDAVAGLGLTWSWRGDWQRAKRLFSDALQRNPDHELAFYSQVRALASAGQSALAWRLARARDLQTHEKDAELGLLLAGLAARINAVDLVEHLATRPATDPDLQRRQDAFLATHLIRRGRYEEGLRRMEWFATLDSHDYDALLDAADAYAAADQRTLARQFYERAARVTPQRPEARLGLARLSSREGRVAGGLALYQAIVAENSESLEGWLGVIRSAQFLNDAARVEEALAQAWRIAPRSALLHQEELRLALQNGDAYAFRDRLRRYLADQPDDRVALLWSQRWQLGTDQPLQDEAFAQLLDPLAPDLTSQALRLCAADPDTFACAIASLATTLGTDDLHPHAETALGERLAVHLLRLPPELQATLPAGHQAWLDTLAQGWWAYAYTPFAYQAELPAAFDAQAMTVWLVAELERRWRALGIEKESGLEDEWRLMRALWFSQWRGQWERPAAAEDLHRRLLQMMAGGDTSLRLAEIEEAWRRSEQSLHPPFDALPQQIERARWRQYRYDYAGAAELLRRLQSEHPLAVEPAQRHAEILSASGRLAEAARFYRLMANTGQPSPAVRLHYANLLRRLGRQVEAEQQLDWLQKEGFAEPDWYLQRMDQARASGLAEESWTWLAAGRKAFPHVITLQARQAEELWRRQQPERLATMLAEGPVPAWIHPDLLASAQPHLSPERLREILRSPRWWFTWRWLPWLRLPNHTLSESERRMAQSLLEGQADLALQALWPAVTARLPDSDLWFKAARVLDLTGRQSDSRQAFHLAWLLGLGREDARIGELTELAHRRPIEAAREFARILDERPDSTEARKGLILSLLRAGEFAAADQALTIFIESAADDPEVQMLTAQVRSAMGRLRSARSLYASLLRADPLAADTRAARVALQGSHEWEVATGLEYDLCQDNTGSGPDPDDWLEAFVSASWRRPIRNTYTVEYHWYRRFGEPANQMLAEWTQAANRDWVVRLNGSVALSGDFIPKWRMGGGANYRLRDHLFTSLDLNYLAYVDTRVAQVVPGLLWGWHPRSTLETRLYLSQSQFDAGGSETGFTWLCRGSWQLSRESVLLLHGAVGNENNLDPIPGLIGNDRFAGGGISLRLGWRHRWQMAPAYRFEAHETYLLHGLGLSLSCRF